MAAIHITDIEAAINFWREKKPSPDGVTLAPEVYKISWTEPTGGRHTMDS